MRGDFFCYYNPINEKTHDCGYSAGSKGSWVTCTRGHLRSLIWGWNVTHRLVSSHYSHSPRRMTQLPFRILFEKDIQSFLSGADQYTLTQFLRKKVLVLIRIFLFLFLYRICSFCIGIIFWKHLFLDLQTGISIEYSFLWSGSQVLLRWHSLSRRHRQYSRYFCIWRYNRSCVFLLYALYIYLIP